MTEVMIANLYAACGLISILAYWPQINNLRICREAQNEISIKTWTIWALEGGVALAYGVFCLKDFLFCALTMLDLVLVVTIIVMVMHNRYVRSGVAHSLSNAAIRYYLCRPFFDVAPVVVTQTRRSGVR